MLLEISQNSQENNCARVSFLTKLQAATLFKKRYWHRCFPVNFAKFLRTTFLKNTSGRPLLKNVLILDQVYSNTRILTQVKTNQHESTRINTSQHESTRARHESTRINTSPTRVNTSQTQVNTNQHESDTNQHESTQVQHKSTRFNTNQHETTRVNTSQTDHEIIIVYRSLVCKL